MYLKIIVVVAASFLLSGCSIYQCNDSRITLTPMKLPEATVGKPYAVKIDVTDSGVLSGFGSNTLPAGLTLFKAQGHAMGLLSGIPKKSGSYTVSLTVSSFGTMCAGRYGNADYVLAIRLKTDNPVIKLTEDQEDLMQQIMDPENLFDKALYDKFWEGVSARERQQLTATIQTGIAAAARYQNESWDSISLTFDKHQLNQSGKVFKTNNYETAKQAFLNSATDSKLLKDYSEVVNNFEEWLIAITQDKPHHTAQGPIYLKSSQIASINNGYRIASNRLTALLDPKDQVDKYNWRHLLLNYTQ